jgi:pimeloyl-ACP methyl ester carboxylesterase
MNEVIEEFEVHVPDGVLEDLRRRLTLTRFPDQIPGTSWEYGMPIAYLRDLVEYWRDAYDWRAQEARINQLSHYRTTIDGQSIHFVRARSERSDAFPLLLIHGWPGSFIEFLDAIPRLVNPEKYGGHSRDAFDVVIPSLPGYGYSEPPRTPGWDVERIADAFVALMDRLGYQSYGAQGGDWGAQVTTRIGLRDPRHCAGIHLNMPLGAAPQNREDLSDDEKSDLDAMAQFQREESGYANEQGTKPQTLGVALNDSPAGLLAWIVEKFRTWSDCGGHPENSFSRDQLITNVMLYWLTETSASSARLYWESRHSGSWAETLPFIGTPTGVARFPKEVLRWPRSLVERQYNVTHWSTMPRGGHFAAMEQPDLFADDVRDFFRTVRERQ